MQPQPTLSIILPCLNEESGLEFCLPRINSIIKRMGISAEVLVVDNGCTDNSIAIALKNGACVVEEPVSGYGAACMKGFSEAHGKYLFLADADGSYDFEEIPRFFQALEGGADFVLGNRFAGKIERNAMPWANRYLGNPVLSFILRAFFKSRVQDVHCGMRALPKIIYEKMPLKTSGMEFASEMIVIALKKNLHIAELPISYHQRKGVSKLRRVSDGWRHLRFMLLYKPFFLFFLPGVLMFSAGLATLFLFYLYDLSIFGVRFYYHPMFLSSLLVITGYQLVLFALFAKTYAINHLGDAPILERLYRYMNIERVSILGLAAAALGTLIFLMIFIKWLHADLGALNEIKNSILALTLVVLGVQTFFSAFMLSVLGIGQK